MCGRSNGIDIWNQNGQRNELREFAAHKTYRGRRSIMSGDGWVAEMAQAPSPVPFNDVRFLGQTVEAQDVLRRLCGSGTVDLRKINYRHKGFALVVPFGHALPLPRDVRRATDLRLTPVDTRKGSGADQTRLYAGDFALRAEAKHHRRPRGMSWWLYYCDESGHVHEVRPSREIKMRIGRAINSGEIAADSAIMKGSGDPAACARITFAIRAGFVP